MSVQLSNEMSIPEIELSAGSCITVLIIGSSGNNTFIVQPYTPHLMELMKTMRSYYEKENIGILSNPMTGSVCCVRNSEDKCWYRVELLRTYCSSDQSDDVSNGRRYYIGLFVDYGITDIVCGDSLYPLNPVFTALPRQAFTVAVLDTTTLRSPSQLVGSLVCLGISGYGTNSSYKAIVLQQTAADQNYLESVTNKQSLKLPDIDFPFTAVVAHVNSVTDFYIHKLDLSTAQAMKELEDVLQSYYLNETNHQRTQEDFDVVCIYSNHCDLYCRGVVMETREKESLVHIVDYGHTEIIPSRDLLKLHDDFFKFPVFAIHCQLTSFSSCSDNDHYNKMFTEILTFAPSLRVERSIDEEKEREGALLWNDRLQVDLYSGDGEMSISQLLTSNSGMREDRDWDPMEDEYLSSENVYKERNTSNVKDVTQLNHDSRRGRRRRMKEVPALDLPVNGDVIVLIITSVYSPQRFHAIIPLGTPGSHTTNEPSPASQLDNLLTNMNDYYSTQVFEESCQYITEGEVVAAFRDDCWYRAEIIKCHRNTVMVFTVDYGDIFDVAPNKIRVLKDEFLNLPFQAVECIISDTNSNMSKIEFISKVQDQIVIAEVNKRTSEKTLELKNILWKSELKNGP